MKLYENSLLQKIQNLFKYTRTKITRKIYIYLTGRVYRVQVQKRQYAGKSKVQIKQK